MRTPNREKTISINPMVREPFLLSPSHPHYKGWNWFEPLLDDCFTSSLASQRKLLLWRSWQNNSVLSTCRVEISKQPTFPGISWIELFLAALGVVVPSPHIHRKKRNKEPAPKMVQRNGDNIALEFFFSLTRQQHSTNIWKGGPDTQAVWAVLFRIQHFKHPQQNKSVACRRVQ